MFLAMSERLLVQLLLLCSAAHALLPNEIVESAVEVAESIPEAANLTRHTPVSLPDDVLRPALLAANLSDSHHLSPGDGVEETKSTRHGLPLTPVSGAAQQRSADPVRELLKTLHRRRQFPPLEQTANYSVVLVTKPTGASTEREGRPEDEADGPGRPLPWPRHQPPLPVTATLVGVRRVPQTRGTFWTALSRVARWLGGDRSSVDPRRRRPTADGDVAPDRQTDAVRVGNGTDHIETLPVALAEAWTDTSREKETSTLNAHWGASTMDSKPFMSSLPAEKTDNTTAANVSSEDDILASTASPLSTHNMDQAPVTRYNVQNLVPANGYLPSSPRDGASSGGGHDALYRANTVEPEHPASTRRTLLSQVMLGPLHGWPSGMEFGVTSSLTSLDDLRPLWPAVSSSDSVASRPHGFQHRLGEVSSDDVTDSPSTDQIEHSSRLTAEKVEKEHRTISEDDEDQFGIRRRGRPFLRTRTRPTTTSAILVPPPPENATQVSPPASDVLPLLPLVPSSVAPPSNVTATSGASLLSGNVSHAIWTDLVGGGSSVPAPIPHEKPLDVLVGQLTRLGSGYLLGDPARLDTAPELPALQSQLGQLNGADAVDVLVRVGANLLASRLDENTLMQRVGQAGTHGSGSAGQREPLCKCPKSNVTPGVLAALTSLLALLIYAASVATMAVTGGGTGATATATGRSRPPLPTLPGLRPISAFLLQWLDTPIGWHRQGPRHPFTGRRLRVGWRLQQGGVPINVRQRRPSVSRGHGRRLDWSDLFDSMTDPTATTAPPQAPDYGPPPSDATAGPANPVNATEANATAVISTSSLETGEEEEEEEEVDTEWEMDESSPETEHERVEGDWKVKKGVESDWGVFEEEEETNVTVTLTAIAPPSWQGETSQTTSDWSPKAVSVQRAGSADLSPPQPPPPPAGWRRGPAVHQPMLTARRRPTVSSNRRRPAGGRGRRRLSRLGRLLAWLGGRRSRRISRVKSVRVPDKAVRRGQHLVAVSKQNHPDRQTMSTSRPATKAGERVTARSRGGVSHPRGMMRSWGRVPPRRERQRKVVTQSREAPRTRTKSPRSSERDSHSSELWRQLRGVFSQPRRRSQAMPSWRRPRKQTVRAAGPAEDSKATSVAVLDDEETEKGNSTIDAFSRKSGRPMKSSRPQTNSKGPRKPTQKPGLNINVNFSLDNLKAKLKSGLKPRTKTRNNMKGNMKNNMKNPKMKMKPKTPKPYGNKIMCDCKSDLGDLLGFLPLALLVGYSTSVSAAAAASSGATAGSVTVTINDADTTTIANTNSPTLTNTDNDVITTAANANPVNTNTNTLTNNDNDVITNTNTATNNGRSAATGTVVQPYRTAVAVALLRVLSARSLQPEQRFRSRLCEIVSGSRADRTLLTIASVPVSLLLSSHRGGHFSCYHELFRAGVARTCPKEHPAVCSSTSETSEEQRTIHKR